MIDKKWKDTSRTKELLSLIENSDSFVFYDLETTGRSHKNDRIIQFAAMRYDLKNNRELDRINLFIKCPFSIPEKITKINHITDELLAQKGIDEEIAIEKMRNFIKESDIIAGYNNNTFDNNFMKTLYSEYGYAFQVRESIDVYKYAKTIVPPEEVMVKDEKTGKMKSSYKLGIITKYYEKDDGIDFHNALGDVTATISIFESLLKDGKNYIDEENKKEELRKEIPRQDANLLSVSYFSPSQNLKRVYINTDQGTFFYDELKHEWRAKNGNVDSIDMESLKKKIFDIVGVMTEDDLFKEMRKKVKIIVG
ncbi:PolC-type DNA polymerase III [Lacrimispora amygdalina]|uniref:3'-5' exonuclease n=1 Tax=Lacrimispora amygdalina TaxID=253257 RepID=UPI000BE428BD|nr:3'-5' exonuclease [Lacrimispora amygdalina]